MGIAAAASPVRPHVAVTLAVTPPPNPLPTVPPQDIGDGQLLMQG